MRTRTLMIGITATAALALTACNSSDNGGSSNAGSTPTATTTPAVTKKIDCNDPNLSQADWMAHCGDNGAGGGGLHKQFGETYTWPDGVKATVIAAKVFTGYDKSMDEKPTPGSTDFRLSIRITNGSQKPIDLSTFSTITNGATNGGQAKLASWTDQGSPLEGQLAPGVTATKTDDGTLETKYGRKISVTLQRVTDGLTPFPDFAGSITG